MKLSILICTIPSRFAMFSRLQAELWSQILPYAGQVEILLDGDSGTIGEKRNRLLEKAAGEYVAFIDDDDMIGINYIQYLMEAIESGADCASLKGLYSVDGKADGVFEHSIKYHEYKTNNFAVLAKGEVKYERFPNHISCIKSDIAKRFKFQDANWGEDTDWATQIYKSGLIKTEHYISDIIYFYRFLRNK